MTPGHHLLLHLKNPRIQYPVAQNLPAARRTGGQIMQSCSNIFEARTG